MILWLFLRFSAPAASLRWVSTVEAGPRFHFLSPFPVVFIADFAALRDGLAGMLITRSRFWRSKQHSTYLQHSHVRWQGLPSPSRNGSWRPSPTPLLRGCGRSISAHTPIKMGKLHKTSRKIGGKQGILSIAEGMHPGISWP